MRRASWKKRAAAVLLLAALIVAGAPPQASGQPELDRHLAEGEALYKTRDYDGAVREFKAAVTLQPGHSMAHLWLGRALGREAKRSGRLRALLMVNDIRQAFERAVQLAPDNVEARSDLLDFYLGAPPGLGGGIDRARRQADAIMQLDRAEGHSAYARIAVKERRWDAAEQEYRLAIEAQPTHEGHRRDLEAFLNKYGHQLKHDEPGGEG